MARLCKSNLGSVQVTDTGVTEIRKSWLDYLPHGCELPDLFRTGKTLDECLDIVRLDAESLSKTCAAVCNTDCTVCHTVWQKASAAMVLQKQIDKAFAGDVSMLTWYGKAVLRQQEPQANEEQIVPSVIEITGLDVNQEAEIDQLRQQLVEAQRKLKEVLGADNAGETETDIKQPSGTSVSLPTGPQH